MVGIVGYGTHLPRHRIKVEEIAKVWGADAPSYKKGLMLREKSVPPPDMDTITLSVGVAVFPEHGSASDAILRAADAALYRAKHAGRDQVAMAD